MTAIAHFDIQYNRFLDEQGRPTQPLPAFARDAAALRTLYRVMTLTRIFDAKAVALQRTGRMGTFPSSLGQEAIAAGIGHALHPDDVFCPGYRDQGTMYLRGIPLSHILAFWGGDERGSDFPPSAREDFPISVPIAGQCLHAAGVAYAIKLRKQARAVVTPCGDGGTSKGDFYEAINFSGTQGLPVVFVVNNNQWAISVPRSAQTASATLAQKAVAAGFDGLQVDGNDVIAVRHAVAEAIAKARSGGGPTLIEAVTYRLCDHTTADDASRYRDKAEVDAAWKHEPIARLRSYLAGHDHWSEADEKKLQDECTREVETAVATYFDMPPQAKTDMLDYLYAELPEALLEQREQLTQ